MKFTQTTKRSQTCPVYFSWFNVLLLLNNKIVMKSLWQRADVDLHILAEKLNKGVQIEEHR